MISKKKSLINLLKASALTSTAIFSFVNIAEADLTANFGTIMQNAGATHDGVVYSNYISGLLETHRLSDVAIEIFQKVENMDTTEQVSYVDKEANLAAEHKTAHQKAGIAHTAIAVGGRPTASSNENTTAGASSGDDLSDKSMGVWTSGFGSIANQKTRKSVPGFKSNTYGGILGFDNAINDTTTLGVVVSIAEADMKHQGVKSGDKTHAKTYVFSLYGTHEYGNSWITQGHAMAGKSFIKSRETHLVGTGGITALSNSKYNSMLYSTELLGGYRYKTSETTNITPMAGLNYSFFGKTKYDEVVNGSNARTITSKEKDRLAGVVGVRAEMIHDLSKANIVTGFYAFAEYDFLNKAPQSNVTLGGINNPVATGLTKPSPMLYKVGADSTTKVGPMEYGISYGMYLADRYVGHQGSVKVRVNF